jgi:hypothetical protein
VQAVSDFLDPLVLSHQGERTYKKQFLSMFFCLDTKEPKSQGKFKSPAMVVSRTGFRYPCHDHHTRHRTRSRLTKFSFAIAL